MVIYRFPPESGKEGDSGNQSESRVEGKTPDFIYIDDQRDSEGRREQAFQKDQGFSSGKVEKAKYPNFLRMLTLIVAAALTTWICILAVIFLIVLALVVISFLQAPSLVQLLGKVWRMICRFCAYALSLYVATLSPAFGFGMLALYTMQHGQNWENSPLGSMFAGRFGKAP